jgi:hypothetical protein
MTPPGPQRSLREHMHNQTKPDEIKTELLAYQKICEARDLLDSLPLDSEREQAFETCPKRKTVYDAETRP